ncbi:MAG: diguanylate cyclase [Motiliproteus sp.]|jgi:diguanylate cyclase
MALGTKGEAFIRMQQVGEFCQSHQIDPIPLNYVVSYEHLSGNHPQLSLEMAQQLQQGHRLNHFFMARLHDIHLAPGSKELANSTSQVEEIIHSLLSSMRDSSGSVGQLTRALDQGLSSMSQKNTAADMKPLLSHLLKVSLNAQQDQLKLGQQLQQAKANAVQLQERLHISEQLAMTDTLTGLLNRTGMNHHLQRLQEFDEQPLSLAMFDIDHFKRFNDDYGHLLGDKVLQVVAQRIKAAIGEQNLAIRFGGEELLIILPNVTLAKAIILADKVRTKVEQVRLTNKRTQQTIPNVTISAGVAELHSQESWEMGLERADRALYRAKDNGRNQVQAAS